MTRKSGQSLFLTNVTQLIAKVINMFKCDSQIGLYYAVVRIVKITWKSAGKAVQIRSDLSK